MPKLWGIPRASPPHEVLNSALHHEQTTTPNCAFPFIDNKKLSFHTLALSNGFPDMWREASE
jgi:hypothetical protein